MISCFRIVPYLGWTLVGTLLCATPLAAQEAGAGPAVRGIYALGDGTKPIPAAILRNPDVVGVSLRAGWEQVEPAENQYRWVFDKEIARARAAGKKVMLRISAGTQTPQWVYAAGAEAFHFQDQNPFRADQGKREQIPVPWDPVFLKKWTAFVRAFGQKYASDDALVLVHLSGPVRRGAEMHLPKTESDKANWARIGYTSAKLIGAWKGVIDAYNQAFADKPLGLNVALPIEKDGVVEGVAAYAAEKLGPRLCVQHNGLSAKTAPGWPQHKWVRAYRGRATVGFQMLCPVTPQGRLNAEGKRFGGSLDKALGIGLESGASYFEIYLADLQNPSLASEIHGLARRLASK